MDGAAQQLRNFAASHPEIQAVFVFGSIVSRATHKGSDVDVAILLQHEMDDSESSRLSLTYCVELEDRLRTPVDVVILNNAGPLLRFQVFRKGKMICSTDVNQTRRFIGNALVEFYDEIVLIERMQDRAIRGLIGR